MMFSKRVHLVLDVEDGGATIRFKHTCGQSFEHYEGSWTFAERDGRTHSLRVGGEAIVRCPRVSAGAPDEARCQPDDRAIC